MCVHCGWMDLWTFSNIKWPPSMQATFALHIWLCSKLFSQLKLAVFLCSIGTWQRYNPIGFGSTKHRVWYHALACPRWYLLFVDKHRNQQSYLIILPMPWSWLHYVVFVSGYAGFWYHIQYMLIICMLWYILPCSILSMRTTLLSFVFAALGRLVHCLLPDIVTYSMYVMYSTYTRPYTTMVYILPCLHVCSMHWLWVWRSHLLVLAHFSLYRTYSMYNVLYVWFAPLVYWASGFLSIFTTMHTPLA